MNQSRMSQGRTGKSSAASGGAETVVWNRCSYQVPAMVGTKASTYFNLLDCISNSIYLINNNGRFMDVG